MVAKTQKYFFSGFKQDYNGERNAEAYFKVTKDFHGAFGCNFTNFTADDQDIENFNEFY